jgi:ankyrin repeat protein
MNKITMIALSTLIAAGPMIKADPAKEKKPLEFVPRPQANIIHLRNATVTPERHVDSINKKGETLLHLAKTAEETEALLRKGESPNAKDKLDYTPLHWASVEKTEVLLSNRHTDVNAKNYDDETPLHITVHFIGASHSESLKKTKALLLHPKTNVNALDKRGRTALDCAVSNELRELLKAHGAKSSKELQ